MIKDVKELGIPPKLIRLVKLTIKSTYSKVRVGNKYTGSIEIKEGVRQGDALSTLLFNLILEGAMKKVYTDETVLNKSVQITGYADDIAISARSITALKETFIKLETETKKRAFDKRRQTKYLKMTRAGNNAAKLKDLTVGEYNFDGVRSFKYLGIEINENNATSEYIQERLQKANKCYYAHSKLFSSKLLTRTTKMRIYKTIIRPVATYGMETIPITQADKNSMRIFERKILRKIYGPIYENGTYRIRRNDELEELVGGENIVRFIKAQRLRWLGHIERMEDTRAVKKAYSRSVEGVRRRGRPKKRWIDDVYEDLRTMGINNWKQIAQQRKEWAKLVKEAKVHNGL